MFRFANPIYLYILGGFILLITILFLWERFRRKKRLARYGDPELVKQLLVDVSPIRPTLKFILCAAAFAMLMLALARPQNGTKQSERERYGIEAMVALDVSNSMLAQDVHPSRLDKSKRLVSNMMTEMTDDQIGMVIFAGDAFIQLPITSDFISAKMFLDQINPGMITLQGTDIARAIDLSVRSFTQRDDVNRAIFIITDGEDNEGGAIEAAKEAASKGIHVFVLGVGGPQGAKIPIPGSTQYMIDEQGNHVMSKLNEQMCREIAQAGKGAYIYVDNSSSAQDALNKEIDKLAKTKLEAVAFSEYNEKYQIFLLLGIVLLILDVLILARENHLFKRINIFRDKTTVFILLGMLTFASCSQNSIRDYIRRGNRHYRQAKVDTTALDNAVTEYQKALAIDSTSSRANYNLGNAYLMQGVNDSISLNSYKAALANEQNPVRIAKISHNMGVLLQKNKQFAQAIECYKESLRNNPNDDETRYNLALCQHQLKDEQNDGTGGGGGGGDGQDDNQQDQNGDQNNQQQDQNQDQNKDQQNQDQQQQNQDQQEKQEQQQQQPKQNELSKEAAEQMLNAAMQNERQTQDRLNRYNQRKEELEQRANGPRRLQKNW